MRVWRSGLLHWRWTARFQLTHPWGCDPNVGRPSICLKISTHTPVRVWQFSVFWSLEYHNFNSHTREGVTVMRSLSFFLRNFNSHTREGVTHHYTDTFRHNVISTHTPVRVWHKSFRHRICVSLFQLTHPWGCDSAWRIPLPGQDYFNSHTREGVTQKTCEKIGT